MERPSRRRVIAALCSGALAGLGGCGNEERTPLRSTLSPTPTATPTRPPPTARDCGSAAGGAAPDGSDWRYRADAANTGARPSAPGPGLDGADSAVDVSSLYRVTNVGISPPVAVDDRVVFAAEGALNALDRDGTIAWRAPPPANRTPVSLADGGVVYAKAGERPTVAALDPASGCERWSVRTGAADHDVSALDATDETVFFDAGPTFRAVSAADGTERWTFESEVLGYVSGVAVADDLVVVGGETRRWRWTPPTDRSAGGPG